MWEGSKLSFGIGKKGNSNFGEEKWKARKIALGEGKLQKENKKGNNTKESISRTDRRTEKKTVH